MTGKPGISLYFHIPFCTKKCPYCHFFVLPKQDALIEQYMEALEREFQQVLPKLQGHPITSVYFGGGTPALVGPGKIARILSWVESKLELQANAEITLEANPENVTQPLMEAFRTAGINRVSLGLQSLDDGILQGLGRTHSAVDAIQAVHDTHNAGIENISVDLMYDVPKQGVKDWRHSLGQVAELPITHLSLYNLVIEPQSVFFKQQKQVQGQMPDDELSLELWQMALEKLAGMGLQQYEISAFCKPGYQAEHNTGYWKGRPFWGFGPSAFSYWEGRRFRNVANHGKYCRAMKEGRSAVDFEEKLEPEAAWRELFSVGIRLVEGVDMSSFEQRFGPQPAGLEEGLTKLQNLELVEGSAGYRWRLTDRGRLFYDTVALELI